jgi:hypothetical protein
MMLSHNLPPVLEVSIRSLEPQDRHLSDRFKLTFGCIKTCGFRYVH